MFMMSPESSETRESIILEVIFSFLDARHVIVKEIIFLESAHFEYVVKKLIIALSQEKAALYRREIPKVEERQGGKGDQSYREDDKYLPFYGTQEPPQDRIAKNARTMPKGTACHHHHFSPKRWDRRPDSPLREAGGTKESESDFTLPTSPFAPQVLFQNGI